MKRFDWGKLFNSISEGIMAVDENLRIISFNEAASKITGWSPNEVIGKECYEVFKNSYCKKNCNIKQAMTQSCNCYLSRIFIKTKQGKAIPLKISVMPLKGENNEVIGAVQIFSDQRELYPTDYEKFHNLGLVGSSPPMREVFQLIETVAETDANVMILGKTGTGKEVVAHAIHNLSSRCDEAIICVNCVALSDTLLESELFGHERGAFTGAVNKRIGRFEMADKGTIFLDEIAETSPCFQAKLLRILQEGEYERVGSSITHKVDVRVIVATNKDLEELVEQKLFREDLYYRLNVFPIHIPELKERKSDIKPLVEYFINLFNAHFKKQKQGVSEDAMALLYKYNYPGNIRELRNIIEHAFIKSPGNIISKEHLPAVLLRKEKHLLGLTNVMHQNELDYINNVILQCNGNKSKAAKILGISRKTLYNKLNEKSV